MLKWMQSLFKPTVKDPDLAHHQYLLNIVLLALGGPGLVFGVVMLILWILGKSPLTGALAGLGVQPLYLLAYWIGRRGRPKLAAYIPVIVVFIAMSASLFQVGVGHISSIGLAMVVVAAGILISHWAAAFFVVLSVAVYLLGGLAQTRGFIPTALLPAETVVIDSIGLALGLAVLMVFNWISNRESRRSLNIERDMRARLQNQSRQLEAQISERTKNLERRATHLLTTAEVAKLTSKLLPPDELITQAVEVIRSLSGYYHVSVFMLGEGGMWANLAASTGEAGRKLLARNHRLALGSASVIGWVTANAKTRISQDVDRDPFHFRNPLLPDTQSEMAVPLIVGESLIGALDVQSKDRNAFTEDDVRMIETIADELAVAIENARLLRDSRQQLKRFESAYREQARQSWSRIASMFDETEVYFGAGEGGEEAQFETIAAASRSGEVVLSEDRREIAVPVRMRDDIIAAIAARKSQEGEQWEQEDVAMLQAVAAQTALALEGARRYAEEHRRVAELEVVNRVSQAVSQHLRLDSLYRVVHNQINQVLGETDMYIAIYHPETEQIAFPYISENKEMIQREPAPFGKGLASLIIQTRQPLLLQEDTERRASALGTEILGKEAKSWLGVPLIVGDDVIGVLSVQDPAVENRFTEDDAALLTTLASQVATALQSAQLLDQVQRSARRERLIHQIASKVRRAPDVKTVLETTATELRRALNASGAAIRLDREPRALGDESSPTGEETLNSEEKSSPEEPVA